MQLYNMHAKTNDKASVIAQARWLSYKAPEPYNKALRNLRKIAEHHDFNV